MSNQIMSTAELPDGYNTSLNETEDYTSKPEVQIAFYFIYASIFLLGICGNALVCYVVARNKQMHTVTNLLITNLALSDILLCVLAVPFTPLYTFMGAWVFGSTLCCLVPYAQAVSVYISTFTLTSIAIDRFLVILYPFRPRMKIKACTIVIVGIWIVAGLLSLPYGLFRQMDRNETLCEENFPSESFRRAYSTITTILQFIVPFLLITVCYIFVSFRLNSRSRMRPGCTTSRREEADRERKRRTNRMLISMVAIFGISWLPLNIINVVEDFYSKANDWPPFKSCFFLAHCIAMSSTCYNPFLYAWLNENFRKEFKQVLPCFSRASSDGTSRNTEGGRSERMYNGNDTVQESLLPVPTLKQNNTSCEMISLEPINNETSKDQKN